MQYHDLEEYITHLELPKIFKLASLSNDYKDLSEAISFAYGQQMEEWIKVKKKEKAPYSMYKQIELELNKDFNGVTMSNLNTVYSLISGFIISGIKQDEYIMSFEEFVDNCKNKCLMDYDGWGDLIDVSGENRKSVNPSEVLNPDYVKPEWATHVNWYNR